MLNLFHAVKIWQYHAQQVRRWQRKNARQILEGVKLIKFAESLGGTESLITYPIRQTHTDLTAEECAEKGITDCLLRFSTGIEATQDLIDDLAQAFAVIE